MAKHRSVAVGINLGKELLLLLILMHYSACCSKIEGVL